MSTSRSCTVELCGSPVSHPGANYCTKHLWRLKRTGTLAPRVLPKVSGKCDQCCSPIVGRRDHKRFCSRTCADRFARGFDEYRVRFCGDCKQPMPTPFKGKRKYCSELCSGRACERRAKEVDKDIACSRRDRWRVANVKHGIQRRLVEKQALSPVKRQFVYSRDKWVCQLCLAPVDPLLRFPHRMSASLDHIVPISRGGAHTADNVQLAHLTCNCQKHNTVRRAA